MNGLLALLASQGFGGIPLQSFLSKKGFLEDLQAGRPSDPLLGSSAFQGIDKASSLAGDPLAALRAGGDPLDAFRSKGLQAIGTLPTGAASNLSGLSAGSAFGPALQGTSEELPQNLLLSLLRLLGSGGF